MKKISGLVNSEFVERCHERVIKPKYANYYYTTYLNLKHYYFYLFKQPKKLLLFRFPEANITLKAHRDDPEREAKWKSLGFIPYKAGTIQKLRLFNNSLLVFRALK